MRVIPPALQSRLDSDVTMLARAWIVRRNDGVVVGFTEHDQPINIGGVECAPDAGFSSGDLDSSVGLEVDSGAWSGALSADGLGEADLAAGLYDGAHVTALLADWTQPDLSTILWSGTIGETRRGEIGFEAELKSSAAILAAPLGRIYSRNCDATLGDARCGVNLAAPAFSSFGQVANVIASRRFGVAGLDAFASNLFSRGQLRWISGANEGARSEIYRHDFDGATVVLEILELSPGPISLGDQFSVTAGCDKSFGTCRIRFGNQINFRGFPFMPGDDLIQAAPASGVRHDGGSRRG